MMNDLFEANNGVTTNSNRGLTGTAQLTSLASDCAASIINEMSEDSDNYRDEIAASQKDNDAMDRLIDKFSPLESVDISFLHEIAESTLDGMLKSQQSKRSRCKSKAMTLDNYKSLMTAGIAEKMLRAVLGKEKHAGGARRALGSVEMTIEELEALNEDQEKLRAAIRNVQSKKSIMKSKADFDESSERWQSLVRLEAQLKDMRVDRVATKVVEVDTTKDAMSELLEDIDIDNIKAADSKALLAKIADMINKQ